MNKTIKVNNENNITPENRTLDISKVTKEQMNETFEKSGFISYNADNWQDGDIPGCVGIIAYMVEEKDEDRAFRLVRVDSED